MRVTLLSLCDFASVRDGLLTMVSSGISQLSRPSFPSTLEAWVGVTIEVEGASINTDFALNIVDDTDEIVATLMGALNASTADADPHSFGYLTLEFDARRLVVPAPGHYRLELLLGGRREAWVHFYALQNALEEPLTWENIPGLTDKERELYASVMQVDDLRSQSFSNITVNGVRLPAVVDGVVRR